MTEIVERRMEMMTEELEELRRLNIYQKHEVVQILRKRREYERKIASVTKILQDFKDYILFEKGFLSVTSKRSKSKKVEKRSALDYKIMRRIKNLYEIVLQRFPNEFALHLEYFEFCKEKNFINAATSAVENMIKNCSTNPEGWVVASTWYDQNNGDVNKAINLLLKGLALHSNYKALYLKIIKFETQKLKSVSNNELEYLKNICKEKIQIYVKSFCENINIFDDLFELLKCLEEHSFTGQSQDLVIEKLLSNHFHKYHLWHHLAQREKQGLHYGPDEINKKTTKTCLSNCFLKYKEGILRVPPEGKQPLLSLYLDCLIDLQSSSNAATVTIKEALTSAFEEGCKQNLLTEKYYIQWLNISTDIEALKILDKGTAVLPDSIELWKLRMRYAAMSGSFSQLKQVFELGLEALKDRSLPLWFIMIRHLTLISNNKELEALFRRAISDFPTVAYELKPSYIEWLSCQKGSTEAFNFYKEENLANRPCKKDFHKVMAIIKGTDTHIQKDLKVLDFINIHENAVKQFGKDDTDVWIDYMLLFIRFTSNKLKCEEIYKRAKETLNPYLISEFEEKVYNVFKEQEVPKEL